VTEPTEEYEHVPWSQLVAPSRPALTRPVVVAVAVAGGLLAGFLGSRLAAGNGPADAAPPPFPVTSTAPAITAPPDPVVAPPPAPALYTEADLLAVLPEEEVRLAVMLAEAFVTDYFTVVPAAASPPVADPDEPEDAAEPPRQTYVEWARAFRVDGADPGGYAVHVAFRMLAGDASGGFLRVPLQAVRVDVVRAADGEVTVADLPAPVPAPPAGSPPASPEAGEVPADVAAAGRAALVELGLAGEVTGGRQTTGGWRLQVRAAAPGAPPFPMALIIEG
jgi:hypothetical protein